MMRRLVAAGALTVVVALGVANPSGAAPSSAAVPAAPTGPCDLAGPLGGACDKAVAVGGGAVDVVTDPGGAVADAASGAVESGFEEMAMSFGEQAEKLIVKTTTAWTEIPTNTGGQQETTGWLAAELRPLTAFAAVLGLIIAAGKMALSRRSEDLNTAAMGLFRMVAVTTAGTTFLVLAMQAGDEFSAQIIGNSSKDGFNGIATAFTATSIGAPLTFLLGLVAIITCIIQIGLMLVRSALIVVLAGVWPLAAAASIAGESGTQMFKKVSGWLLAFVLYKPAAAIIYAAAFKLMSVEGKITDQTLGAIQGCLLLIMAVIALPAMIRLVVPATSALGGGMSTGGMLAGAGSVATGAVAVAATGGGAATAGGAGAAGPSGAIGAAGGGGGQPPGGGGGGQPPGGGGGQPPGGGGDRPGGGGPGGADIAAGAGGVIAKGVDPVSHGADAPPSDGSGPPSGGDGPDGAGGGSTPPPPGTGPPGPPGAGGDTPPDVGPGQRGGDGPSGADADGGHPLPPGSGSGGGGRPVPPGASGSVDRDDSPPRSTPPPPPRGADNPTKGADE